jgi:hypothetical protein
MADEEVKNSTYKNEYETDLTVDKFNLEEEWNQNGRLAMKWAEKAAISEYNLKMAEQQYKITKAQVDLDVRSSPSNYGWNEAKAPTESFIMSCVRNDPRYLQASQDWAEAIKDCHILKSAENSMNFQRRAACEGLTKLWIFLYRNETRVPRYVQDSMDKQELDKEMEGYVCNS